MPDRERGGHGASPSAAIIDSQTVKTCESGGPRGYDAGKKVNHRHFKLADLPLSFHPAAVRASAVFEVLPEFGPPGWRIFRACGSWRMGRAGAIHERYRRLVADGAVR